MRRSACTPTIVAPYVVATALLIPSQVVPDFSSSLADPREEAETLDANHMELCRFTDANDSNYRKVGGELREIHRMLKSVQQLRAAPEGNLAKPLDTGIPVQDKNVQSVEIQWAPVTSSSELG